MQEDNKNDGMNDAQPEPGPVLASTKDLLREALATLNGYNDKGLTNLDVQADLAKQRSRSNTVQENAVLAIAAWFHITDNLVSMGLRYEDVLQFLMISKINNDLHERLEEGDGAIGTQKKAVA